MAAFRPRLRGWQARALGSRSARAGRLTVSPTAPSSAPGATTLRSLTELTVIAAAATTDTTIQIPTNAIVVRVEVTVMVAIPTATSFNYGVAGATARYGTTIGVSAFTTYPGTGAEGILYAAPTAIRFTPQATPGAASGRVLTTIYYYSA